MSARAALSYLWFQDRRPRQAHRQHRRPRLSRRQGLLLLDGHVRMVDSTTTVTCEHASFDENKDLLTLFGSVEAVRTGTRLAVTEDPLGTLFKIFNKDYPLPIAIAGKTGTAEYCDDVALQANKCQFGSWPTHSWTLAFAPAEDGATLLFEVMLG